MHLEHLDLEVEVLPEVEDCLAAESALLAELLLELLDALEDGGQLGRGRGQQLACDLGSRLLEYESFEEVRQQGLHLICVLRVEGGYNDLVPGL
jgi:hypothetical protein